MAEHEAGLDGKSAVIEVEVGAADAGAGDSHERVGGGLERGVVDALDAHVVGSVEDSSFHLFHRPYRLPQWEESGSMRST